MYIELTPEQRHLQAEMRQYFSTLISTDEAAEMEVDRHGKAYRAVIRRMGSDGKLGVGWPKEYGGLGFGPIEQQIFVNEAARADVPLPAVTLQADYIWLACRTDPEAAKHKGISILIVDTTDPGYSWTPIILSDGAHHTNATYYNEVRVPVDMLVGEENAGWRLITTQLNHERVMLGPAGKIAGIYDRVHAWASKPGSSGIVPIERDDVRRALGEIKAIWRINELLNWQVAAAGETVDIADAAATKVFSTERIQRIGRLAEEIVGAYGNPADDETAEMLKWLDSQTKRSLVITFGGGVNEVMREQVAAAGLGVPRVPR